MRLSRLLLALAFTLAVIIALIFSIWQVQLGLSSESDLGIGLGQARVCFGNECILAEVADDAAERAAGLMFREELGLEEGMLFIFPEEEKHGFWMKNTLIPLTIVWVDSRMEVVHIENAVPCNEEPCPLYVPEANALYVVEMHPDFAKGKIRIGTKVGIEMN